MDDDAEIIAEFLVESHENLDQLDQDLVELETSPESKPLLGSIFRTIHTIKGTSGFLSFNELERLTHIGEHVLSQLRDGKLSMTQDIATALLSMVDTVRALLAHIETHGNDQHPTLDIDAVIAALDTAARATSQPQTPQPVPVAPTPSQPATSLRAAELDQPAAPSEQAGPAEQGPNHTLTSSQTNPAPALAHDAVSEEPTSSSAGVAGTSVRVDVSLLDSLMQLVGELVLTRNQIMQRVDGISDGDLNRSTQRLDVVASELQEHVMRTRMQPIAHLWAKMPRLVRDLSATLGRDVELTLEGHETELDRTLLEALRDPLTHMVRNALDHGIEPPEQRVHAGKPSRGNLRLSAYHESGQVVVDISDDGKGIDPQVIAESAIAKGVVTRDRAAAMSTREVLDLVFAPGFSTAAAVTNVSGRGVGMDVVRTNIEKIGGTVELNSRPGQGTTCRLRIPLTLAIIPALIVSEADDRYAIPQTNLVELVRLDENTADRGVEYIAGAPVLRLRGQLLPLLDLRNVLSSSDPQQQRGWAREAGEAAIIVVVQVDGQRLGLAVSSVHDTQEIVVKPLGRQVKDLPTFAGATILGDGRVALILDIPGLATATNIQGNGTEGSQQPENTAPSTDTSVLVVELHDRTRVAIPLDLVTRIEEFEPTRVEQAGGGLAVQYRDGILPLIDLASLTGSRPQALNDTFSVVVHDAESASLGLIIHTIVDIAPTPTELTPAGARQGVSGTAVIRDRITDVLDLNVALRGNATARALVGTP